MTENSNGNSKPKYEGETVWLGGREWVVPSLSVLQARKLWPEMILMDEGVTVENLPEKQEIGIKLIHAALSRNYPELTLEEVGEMVDLSNYRKIMLVVSGQSGTKPVPGGEPAGKVA